MPKRTCLQCRRQIIEAVGPQGESLELALVISPRTYTVKAVKIETPIGPRWTNTAGPITAWTEHGCHSEAETLGAPGLVQEFPSLGDPAPEADRTEFPTLGGDDE